MDTSHDNPPPTESWLDVASMFGVGLGIITFALFPLLIPGLAVLALFGLPLLPLLILPLLLAPIWFLGRAVIRLTRRATGRRTPASAELSAD